MVFSNLRGRKNCCSPRSAVVKCGRRGRGMLDARHPVARNGAAMNTIDARAEIDA